MYRFKSRGLPLLIDAVIVFFAFILAYVLRFEGSIPRHYLKQLLLVFPYLVFLRLALFALFGNYRLIWRFVSLADIPRFAASTVLGTGLLIAARFLIKPIFSALGLDLNAMFATVPYGVLGIEFIFTLTTIIAARATWRLLKEKEAVRGRAPTPINAAREQNRALLVGAGAAGFMVAREARTNANVGFEIVGFLDDDKQKQNSTILGYKVFGTTAEMTKVAEENDANMVVITMASAPPTTIREIVNAAEDADLKVKIIPGLYEILSGAVNISKIRDVAIEDLLGRAPVQLEVEAIGQFLTDKIVMVSGGGGSIGSEMCRQVCRFHPRKLIILDQAENPVFHIHRELARLYPQQNLVQAIGSVAEFERLQQIFKQHHPQVVFHAAAHKHVPLMELNPGEAIRNNIIGSRNMADLAHQCGAEAFVMISTDKAVNPTSVMGTSKRIAEMYVQALARHSQTRFITVRFGNVLASEGSVVPIFKEQIARGGPVTITHPEMKRYFMTIPEASQLVLQAATMGHGGEIFILEMGEPIKILHLARDLIRLSGLRPDTDIAIEYTGLRPGEKLYEEINLSEENAAKTKHPRIWIGHSAPRELNEIRATTDYLFSQILHQDSEGIRNLLQQVVPEYQPTVLFADQAAFSTVETESAAALLSRIEHGSRPEASA